MGREDWSRDYLRALVAYFLFAEVLESRNGFAIEQLKFRIGMLREQFGT